MNDFDKNSSNFWKLKLKLKNFMETQAKTQEFYGNSRQNFAKNSIFRQVQSPTMPKKWPKKIPELRSLMRSWVSSAQSYSAKNKVYLMAGHAQCTICTYTVRCYPHVNIYLWRKCEAVVPVAVLQAD